MKTKPISATVNTPEPLPNCEQLAMIAAATQRKNPADAVRHGLAVWYEAAKALREAAVAQALRESGDVALPRAFPATLADFLRLVVGGKVQGDGQALLRRFYREERVRWCRDETEAAEYAVAEIAAWKAGGFKTEAQWLRLAKRFRDWRKQDKSRASRESASKRTKWRK